MKTAKNTKKIAILTSAIAGTKALLSTLLDGATTEEADALGLSDFIFELNDKKMEMEWALRRLKDEKLEDEPSAMAAQQLCAESFYAQEERDNKKHVNTPGAPIAVAHNPEVLILADLNLDNSAAEVALQEVENKGAVRVINLQQNNLTSLPERSFSADQ